NYRRANARLRDAAHALSSVRDADSTLNTLKTLHGRYPGVVTRGALRALLPGLRARKRQARRTARRTMRRAAAALKRARQILPRQVGRVGDFKAVHAGALRTYRAARRSMRGLTVDGAAAEFHEWRKRVKDYWYDLRLFEGLHPAPRGRVRSIGQLEELLGDAHDLAMLHDQLLDGSARYANARTRALMLGAISKGETSLRSRALQLGHRTFAERPRHFDKSLRTWWEDR
ncbi:MAG TPA: CHAD domain-containing protein, partial [Gemmatimonadales bacterium]|nr:CHAD domain-containing protein [Gemmatimonadales bacterium]